MLLKQQSPLVLTAISLHAIGSYLQPTRLELHPLTILCGKNGAGKSTWLKALELLQRSLLAGKLPYGFEDCGNDCMQLTSDYFYHATPMTLEHEMIPGLALAQDGPPGTIGLEFVATRGFSVTNPDRWVEVPEKSVATPVAFMHSGACPAGTRFQVRISHPSYWDDGVSVPGLFDMIHLRIEDVFNVLMIGERDPGERFEQGQNRPQRSKPYLFGCTSSFLPGHRADDCQLAPVAVVTDLMRLHCEPTSTSILPEQIAGLVALFEKRMRELLYTVLSGVFYIGAVRQLHTYASVDECEARTFSVDSRHVGKGGDRVWVLERALADYPMRAIKLDTFSPDDIRGYECLRLFTEKSRCQSRARDHIWNLAAPEFRQRAGQIVVDRANEQEAAECMAELLNSVLPCRELFVPEYWGEGPPEENGDEEWLLLFEDSEISEFAHTTSVPLDMPMLRHLNRLLIEDALKSGNSNEWGLRYSSAYSLEGYVSWWMRLLTDVSFKDQWSGNRRCKAWQYEDCGELEIPDFPTGILLWPHGGTSSLKSAPECVKTLHILAHPCFGEGTSGYAVLPGQLSSGFHQLLPIVVQLGLMKSGELLGVENPEVHLHPALQLKVAGMLVHHAASGRQILVETHSDLFVRRTIRAILEEELPQSQMQIYFIDLDQVIQAGDEEPTTSYRYSSLTPIRIDQRGRIANWPDGFLDDDVRESQRLLDIMYGGSGAGDDDE